MPEISAGDRPASTRAAVQPGILAYHLTPRRPRSGRRTGSAQASRHRARRSFLAMATRPPAAIADLAACTGSPELPLGRRAHWG